MTQSRVVVTPRWIIDPGRFIVAVGCLYELAALPKRSPLPTITTIVRWLAADRRLRFLAWLWGGVWSAHFFAD